MTDQELPYADRLNELKEEYGACLIRQREEVRLRHELALQINALHLANRPEYPNQNQLEGITEAARRIHAREVPETHHGDPTAPGGSYDVVVDGKRGFIRLRSLSPWQTDGSGKVWDYTEEELRKIFDAVQSHGLVVRDHWRSDGLSMTVDVIEEPS